MRKRDLFAELMQGVEEMAAHRKKCGEGCVGGRLLSLRKTPRFGSNHVDDLLQIESPAIIGPNLRFFIH